MTVSRLKFMKLALAQHIFLLKKKKPYNKFHVNLTNGLHAKTVSQTDRWMGRHGLHTKPR